MLFKTQLGDFDNTTYLFERRADLCSFDWKSEEIVKLTHETILKHTGLTTSQANVLSTFCSYHTGEFEAEIEFDSLESAYIWAHEYFYGSNGELKSVKPELEAFIGIGERANDYGVKATFY